MIRKVIFLSFGFVFLHSILSCEGDLKTTKKIKNNLNARTEIAKDVEVYFSEKAVKSAMLNAPIMMRQEDSLNRTYFPNGLKVEMFDTLGNLSSVLTAKYGEHDHSTNQMKARDSVVVTNVNGQSLKAKDLIWKPNENQMLSYGEVEIKNKTEVIWGDTLIADENLKRYIVKKVRGIVHVTK